MMDQNIFNIAGACKGTIINRGKKTRISQISTDTRTIGRDSLFIPLVGENFDGHAFIKDAIKKGANAVLVEEGKGDYLMAGTHVYFIQVADTLKALADIGYYYKNLFNIPFIGVTGSVGKTTTKDFIAGVLSARYRVHKNIGNFNNEIGLPLTLFNLEEGHNISVVEMGMSFYGEILRLANIVEPNIAVITNIGLSHIEHFGSRKNIMRAKMEITDRLGENDYLLVNGDDEELKNIAKDNKAYNVVFYGLGPNNDFYASNIENLGEEGSRFTINISGKNESFKIKEVGLHNIYNALAAIWIAIKYGLSPEEIQEGLDRLQLSKMRLELIDANNIKIINDAYNASPDSMKAGLDVLENIGSRRKIAVLGNMFEMGDFAEEGHRDVGHYLAGKKIDLLITVGQLAKWIGLGAKKNGFKEENIYPFNNKEETRQFLEKYIENGDAILIKGSRGMHMEEIAIFLQERSHLNDLRK